jgi:outer membrane protein assembly factor BamB
MRHAWCVFEEWPQGQRNVLAALRCLVLWPLLELAFCCQGTDWPQYRGPTHDGVSTDHINQQWSGSVINPLWQVALPNSISSFTVSGGRAFTQIRRVVGGVDQEVCMALNPTNGAELWATAVEGAWYPDGQTGGADGPRTTPVVDGGSVYVLSTWLKLYRLDATTGAVIWQKDLYALYGGSLIP